MVPRDSRKAGYFSRKKKREGGNTQQLNYEKGRNARKSATLPRGDGNFISAKMDRFLAVKGRVNCPQFGAPFRQLPREELLSKKQRDK